MSCSETQDYTTVKKEDSVLKLFPLCVVSVSFILISV